MRPARAPSGASSATPIYDELYAEYRRSFRALPGDRSGEEELGFVAFGLGRQEHKQALLHSVGRHAQGRGRHAGPAAYGSYTAADIPDAPLALPGGSPADQLGHQGPATTGWPMSARQLSPAARPALPPARHPER